MPFPRKYTHSGIALTFSKPYSCKGNGGYCKMWCVLKSSFYFFSYRVESMSVLTTKLVGQTLQTLGLFSQCQLNWHNFDEHMKIYWSHNIHTEYTWSSPWYTLLLQGEISTGTLCLQQTVHSYAAFTVLHALQVQYSHTQGLSHK